MKLTESQFKAVNEIDSNLQIIACAGSGKTEVIVRRIVNILKNKKDIKAENIVAFTFTEKAAESLRIRTKELLEEELYQSMDSVDDMYIGTIHGFCYKLLTNKSERFKNFKILDPVKSYLFLDRYYKQCKLDELDLTQSKYYSIKLFIECIDKMTDDYENKDEWLDDQEEIFENYRSFLYENKYLDFPLLIFEALEEIRNNIEISEYISKIKYLVVDEYQDINELQERLIKEFYKLGANICVVGDDDQTIYKFRGSMADYMIEFAEKYSDVKQIKLEKNFRSTSKIVDVADKVISNNKDRIKKNMISPYLRDGHIEVVKSESLNEQSDKIAKKIKEIEDEVAYSEIAILVRKNKFIKTINRSLDNYNIPYIVSEAEYFFQGEYFKRFVKTLEITKNINKPELYRCWEGLIDEEHLTEAFKYLRRIGRRGGDARIIPLSEIIKKFLGKTNFLDESLGDYKTRVDDLEGFIEIVDDYDEIYQEHQLTSRIDGVINFLKNHAEREYQYHDFKSYDDAEDKLQIMTIHKSKGLEFDTVFLVGLEEGEFPASNIGGQKYWHVLGGNFEKNKDKYIGNIEDERKLFYVAITRARNNLYMNYSNDKKEVSRFIKEAGESEYLIMKS